MFYDELSIDKNRILSIQEDIEIKTLTLYTLNSIQK